MDSFRMYFERGLTPAAISRALRSAGFETTEYSDEVQASNGKARVYIYLDQRDAIDEGDLLDESDWPIPRERLQTLVGIEVRRNDESSNLAVRVADRLVTDFGGKISWDGMDYWEDLYKAYLATKENRDTRVH